MARARLSPSGLQVDLREARTGRLLYTFPGQQGTVSWLAWSPDSRRLAVSRSNGDIDVWNLNEVEQVLAKLRLDAGKTGASVSKATPPRSPQDSPQL